MGKVQSISVNPATDYQDFSSSEFHVSLEVEDGVQKIRDYLEAYLQDANNKPDLSPFSVLKGVYRQAIEIEDEVITKDQVLIGIKNCLSQRTNIDLQELNELFTFWDEEQIADRLLCYAERESRQGNFASVQYARTLALLCLTIPYLEKLQNEQSSIEIQKFRLQSCINQAGIVKSREIILSMPPEDMQEVSKEQIKGFVRVLCKNAPGMILRYENTLQKQVLDFLSEKKFRRGNEKDLSSQELPFDLLIREEEGGVYLFACHRKEVQEVRKDAIIEHRAAELFIHKNVDSSLEIAPRLVRCLGAQKGSLKKVEETLEKHEKMFSDHEGIGRYFLDPAKVCMLGGNKLFKVLAREPYKGALDLDPTALSVRDIWKINCDIASSIEFLHQQGESYDFLERDSVFFIRNPDSSISAKLAFYNKLTVEGFQPHRDVIGCIRLIGRPFDFTDKKEPLEDLVNKALNKFSEFVSPIHYDEADKLKGRTGGYNIRFATELLRYANSLRENNESSFQVALVEDFALKMILLPKVYELYEEVWRNSWELPAIQKVKAMLLEEQRVLDGLSESILKERLSSSVQSALECDLKIILRRMHPEADLLADDLVNKQASAFYTIINQILEKKPKVGDEFRLQKGVVHLGTTEPSPVDAWVKIQKEGVFITVPSFAMKNRLIGKGGFKSVAGWLKFNLADKAYTLESIALSTMLGKEDLKEIFTGIKVHYQALALEGAEEYIAKPNQLHRSFVNTDGIRVWESECPWYSGDLLEANVNQTVPKVMDRRDGVNRENLTPLDLISMLKDVSKGIFLLGSHGIVHKDIKAQNVFIKVLPDGKKIAVISDFDLAFLTTARKKDSADGRIYWIWDKNAQEGVAFPGSQNVEESFLAVDQYSLIIMISEMLLGGFCLDVVGTNAQRQEKFSFILESPKKAKELLKKKHIQHLIDNYFRSYTQDVFDCSKEQNLQRMYLMVRSCKEDGNEQEKQAALALQRYIGEALWFDEAFALLHKALKASNKAGFEYQDKSKEVVGIKRLEEDSLLSKEDPLDAKQFFVKTCLAEAMDPQVQSSKKDKVPVSKELGDQATSEQIVKRAIVSSVVREAIQRNDYSAVSKFGMETFTKESARLSAENAGFPPFQEIMDLLDQCELIAKMVEGTCSLS